jgi:6-phosphogluconolactonase (cycloisomerase 2 family)
MRIPFKPMGLAAGQVASRAVQRSAGHLVNDSVEPAQLLMTTTGAIFLADFDGSSINVTLNATITGTPSWVEFVEPNLVYAVDEAGTQLRIFHLDRDAATLDETPAVVAEGSSGVVDLEFNKDKTRLVGSGYGAGTIDIWDSSNGGLSLIKTITSDGTPGPGQTAAHPHQANLDPTGRYFAVNDLGTDQIIIIDSQDDAFTVSNTVAVEPAGCGPRHGVFFPSNAEQATHYIVLCETGNLVNVYELNYAESQLEFTQVLSESSFGPGNPVPEGAAAGEIVLASNDVDLYVSNRLVGGASDNIALFKLGPSASSLRWAGSVPSGGVLPRMFSLSKDEQTVFVGNQNGPVGVAALLRQPDGSLEEEPLASLDLSVFGATGFGPPYVHQI